jgi:hypothetical protein
MAKKIDVKEKGSFNASVEVENGMVNFSFRWLPAGNIWIMDVTGPGINVHGTRVVSGVNILRQHTGRQVGTPWALVVMGSPPVDPMFDDDFYSGRQVAYLVEGDLVS